MCFGRKPIPDPTAQSAQPQRDLATDPAFRARVDKYAQMQHYSGNAEGYDGSIAVLDAVPKEEADERVRRMRSKQDQTIVR